MGAVRNVEERKWLSSCHCQVQASLDPMVTLFQFPLIAKQIPLGGTRRDWTVALPGMFTRMTPWPVLLLKLMYMLRIQVREQRVVARVPGTGRYPIAIVMGWAWLTPPLVRLLSQNCWTEVIRHHRMIRMQQLYRLRINRRGEGWKRRAYFTWAEFSWPHLIVNPFAHYVQHQ